MSQPSSQLPPAPTWGQRDADAFEFAWVEFVHAWEGRLGGRSDWPALDAAGRQLASTMASLPHLGLAFSAIESLCRAARSRGFASEGREPIDADAPWARLVSQSLSRLKAAGMEPTAAWSPLVCAEDAALCQNLADSAEPVIWSREIPPRLQRAWDAGDVAALLGPEWDRAELALAQGAPLKAASILTIARDVLASLGWIGAASAARAASTSIAAESPRSMEHFRTAKSAWALGAAAKEPLMDQQNANAEAWTAMGLDSLRQVIHNGQALPALIRGDLLHGAANHDALGPLTRRLAAFKAIAKQASDDVRALTILCDQSSAPRSARHHSALPTALPSVFWGAADGDVVAMFKIEAIALSEALLAHARAIQPGSAIGFELLRCSHGLASMAKTLSIDALHTLCSNVEDWAQRKMDAGSILRSAEAEPLLRACAEIAAVAAAAAREELRPSPNFTDAEWLSLNALDGRQADGLHSEPEPDSESEAEAAGLALGLVIGEELSWIADASLTHDLPSTPASVSVPDELDWEILPGFLLEADELLTAIELDLQLLNPKAPDFIELNRNIHTLKGGSRMAGARALGDLLHTLEEETMVGRPTEQRAREIATMARDGVDETHAMVAQLKARWAERQNQEAELSAKGKSLKKVERLSVDSGELARIESLLADAGLTRLRLQRETRLGLREMEQMNQVESRLDRIANAIMLEAETRIQYSSNRQGDDFDALEFDSFSDLHEHTRRLQEAVSDVVDILGAARGKFESVADLATNFGYAESEATERVKSLSRSSLAHMDSKLRALARQTGKELAKPCLLDLRAGKAMLDRRVLEALAPALEHIVRNAIAHGIEPPAERAIAGKPVDGKITISAKTDGRHVDITISDDGGGVNLDRVRAKGMALGLVDADASNKRLLELLFDAGFSTVAEVNEIAGRGVGLDAVAHIVSSLGGSVVVDSHFGHGATFNIRVPQERSAVSGIVARMGVSRYVIPSAFVAGMSLMDSGTLRAGLADGSSFELDGAGPSSLTWLGDWVGLPQGTLKASRQILRLKGSNKALCAEGFEYVDFLAAHAFDSEIHARVGLMGYANPGDGTIVVVINPLALFDQFEGGPRQAGIVDAATEALGPLVLVVDDSVTIRKVTAKHLASAGYRVCVAENGQVALAVARAQRPDLILMDIEMPVMDGFEALASLKSDESTAAMAVVMISSRVGSRHRDRARELGAMDFLGKPYDREHLLSVIEQILQAARNEPT